MSVWTFAEASGNTRTKANMAWTNIFLLILRELSSKAGNVVERLSEVAPVIKWWVWPQALLQD